MQPGSHRGTCGNVRGHTTHTAKFFVASDYLLIVDRTQTVWAGDSLVTRHRMVFWCPADFRPTFDFVGDNTRWRVVSSPHRPHVSDDFGAAMVGGARTKRVNLTLRRHKIVAGAETV